MSENHTFGRTGTNEEVITHTCTNCGNKMYNHKCKTLCPNCGARMDCSDLF